MGRKVKVQITSSGKHCVMVVIVVVAMTTTTGEVLRDSVMEPSPNVFVTLKSTECAGLH